MARSGPVRPWPQPCLGEAEEVTVPDVSLQLHPGPEVVQWLDVSEQDAGWRSAVCGALRGSGAILSASRDTGERPAAIPTDFKSIDDTSNFDEFPESDILQPTASVVSSHQECDYKNKDWVFINYTYKRFKGLMARGAIPSYIKSGK